MREKFSLTKVVNPYAKALSDKFKEVVHISVLDKNASSFPKHIIIDKVGQQFLSLTPPIGSSTPCHCAAVGKCLLAFSSPEYLSQFIGTPLPSYTANTIVSWDKLLQELEKIRQNGYAYDDEELEIGLTCVAGPIFSRNREAIAAISLSGPRSRVAERFDEIVEEVTNTTRLVSALM
ncbi:Transcriptional repressor IclR [bioreactor metagenome]|uniref:Transcriptional repressor IclR n=1 Tax=bioreactor metagenome TaxID=1076179 RepID=A0A645I8Z8_9ZZZZ